MLFALLHHILGAFWSNGRTPLPVPNLGKAQEFCSDELLMEIAGRMATNMCHLYNDSHLDKLNGFVLSPGAMIILQNYDWGNDTCSEFTALPMNIWFPHVFQVWHTCLAAIPVYSNIGSDGMISVTGYAELIVATQSKIKEMTFVYTQPINDCTLQLTRMTMLDIQCIGKVTPTMSLPSHSTSSIQHPSTSTRLPVTSSPFYDVDKYTSKGPGGGGVGDSINNPILHLADMPICPVKHEKFRLVLTKSNYKYAALVCLRRGYRLAVLSRSDLGDAIDLVGACLGSNKSVWIKQYWNNASAKGRCLELVTGPKPRQGTISIASSCEKPQAVLCEDPYFALEEEKRVARYL